MTDHRFYFSLARMVAQPFLVSKLCPFDYLYAPAIEDGRGVYSVLVVCMCVR